MKTNKVVENVEITPSKKKLTQARLPFKLISEDASTPVAPPTRKRKLSADGTEPAPKGKICKENNEIDDLVEISDDECKDNQKLEKEAKVMNPFVKLVDTAWKKKLNKTKSPKTRKSRKSAAKSNESTENKDATEEGDPGDVEMMEVDTETQNQTGKSKSPKASPKSKLNETEKENKVINDVQNDVVVLEDSNHSTDVQTNKESDTNNHDSKDSEKHESDIDNTEPEETAPITPRTTRKSKADAENEKLNKSVEPAPKTPVRKPKSDAKEKTDKSVPSAKLNESASNPSTPKRNSRSSSVTNSLNDSINESASTPANLTPKQLQKKLESAKKKEEREKERQEREKKRLEEKEEKARQKQEKEDAKKREREEKEEQKRKEKEEKEKQKELEKKLREEKEEQKKKEREEKEEQRRKEKEEKEDQKRKEKEAKEEERRKKQEALELEKQEQELKKKKAAEAFVNFFVPKQKEKEKDQPKAIVSQNSILSSFTIKADMRLAPLIRVEMSDTQKKDMEKVINDQELEENDLYLKNLKKEGVKVGCWGKTWPLTDKEDDDVMIVEDELPPIEGADEVLACEPATREKLRPKLFSFHENKRPPYWGTWRKKSAFVTARRPFGQEKQVDYEVDSDEDWEEEQEGESLDGSVAGDDDEPDDDYEVDNEVFVPHGYLSDEEATMDEEEDKDNVLSLSPETQKARLKNLEDEFETEMKKPTEKLKPRLYGLIWENQDGGKPEKCIDALWNYFGKLAMIMDDTAIDGLLQPPTESQEPEKKKIKKKKVVTEGEQPSPKSDKKKKVKPEKETKKAKPEVKQEAKKNQPGINSFLTKLKST